ncbi:g5767 [Coccomyxa viridis]|uniref:G5767 protein n=1 Tax=Coccomyxa viridis TaxID=1274662 RepID=A0ABP1FWC9_9CHLO
MMSRLNVAGQARTNRPVYSPLCAQSSLGARAASRGASASWPGRRQGGALPVHGKVNIGLEVEKEFDGKTYKGWVTKFFKKENLYHVKYEDDDEEDLYAEELQKIVINPPQPEPADPGASGSAPAAIGKPRRTTRASGADDTAEGSQPKPKRKVKTSLGAGVPSARVPRPDLEERSSEPVSPDTAAAVTLFTMSSEAEPEPEPSPPPPSQPGTPFASPKRKQKTASTTELHSPAGPGASKRAAAAPPKPQSHSHSPKKKSRSAGSKASPSKAPSQAGPSQAAKAGPAIADGPMAEAQAKAAGQEPPPAQEPAAAKKTAAAKEPAATKEPAAAKKAAAAKEPAAAKKAAAAKEPAAAKKAAAVAEPVAKAGPVLENGVGPSEAEATAAAAEAPSGTAVARQPKGKARRTEHDAVEELYKDVDILRTRPATGGRPGPTRFNQVVYNRGMLFLAGQIVDDTSAPGMDTYYGQARQVLHQVEQLLGESGSSMQRILQVAVHLRNIDEGADEFNKAWLEVMDANHLPARTTVQAHLMRPDLLVEVTATAAVWK